jgi:hypothetical protein
MQKNTSFEHSTPKMRGERGWVPKPKNKQKNIKNKPNGKSIKPFKKQIKKQKKQINF